MHTAFNAIYTAESQELFIGHVRLALLATGVAAVWPYFMVMPAQRAVTETPTPTAQRLVCMVQSSANMRYADGLLASVVNTTRDCLFSFIFGIALPPPLQAFPILHGTLPTWLMVTHCTCKRFAQSYRAITAFITSLER